ncbi:MAG TPA: 3-methyl-2-oxobutanoate hydroxymethyltransferase [Pyrinomonadaceae bacterium]|nr:3-methyl-2-oxobutanoate hydroxymethyltransferase [Pyrinomonadaceae bacterium]
MVYLKQQRPEKVTVPAVRASKERGERLVCLTAYDYPTARIVDEAGTDIVLVGDSLGNVVLGYDSTVPVTLEEMLHHTRAVRRGVERALLVADMPYGSYHTGADDAVRAALRLVKEGGAEAVKLEGGRNRVEVIRRLVGEEIPVMGHVGLTPQSLNKLGSYRLQAKTADAARRLVEDTLLLEEAGVFAVVLEVVPREVAREVTGRLRVPTVGIGAGADCDAQILVTHDLLGLSFSRSSPRFVRQYADVRAAMADAINRYAEDVRAGSFPSDAESYPLPADAAAELQLTRDEGKEAEKP